MAKNHHDIPLFMQKFTQLPELKLIVLQMFVRVT